MARSKAPALSDVLDDLNLLRKEIRRDLARLYRELGRINGDQRLVSIRAAARELGVRRSTDGALARAIRGGDLRTVQVGRRTKIRKTDLVQWAEAQTRYGRRQSRKPPARQGLGLRAAEVGPLIPP